MISEEDVIRMTKACRTLPEPVGDYLMDDYLTNLVATVVDFQTHTTVVERALDHFATTVRPPSTACAVVVSDLVDWAEAHAGGRPTPCGVCRPRDWDRPCGTAVRRGLP